MAADKGHTATVEALLAHKANVNFHVVSELHFVQWQQYSFCLHRTIVQQAAVELTHVK